MESTEEPQKKIFKARKTMRVSDRQQLEVVYKVKEELLKTDVKLLNGKHENGDSDLNSPLDNTDCIDGKDMNGIEDVCLDLEDRKTELKESPSNFLNIDIREEDDDSSLKCATASPKNITYEPEKDTVPETDNTVPNSNKDDDNLEKSSTDDENLDQRERESPLEDKTIVSDNTETEEEKLEMSNVPISADLPTEVEKNMNENPLTESAFEEEAISSSMEIGKDAKSEDNKSPGLPETTDENVQDDKNESTLDNVDSMETDEIIPILEKLAPAEDELTSFSKTSLIPLEETNPDLGEKLENSLGSPSKQESSESLPKEAFLVLSDEEETSGEKDVEVVLPNESSSPDSMCPSSSLIASVPMTCSFTALQPQVETETKEKDAKLEEEKEAHKEEERPGKNELLSRRKRSKSEDMDNVQSKRRRYLGEEYEAELQVKITARGDINQKLQKVVQRLLEEKLSALQCAVFDKTLADLKMRVEKIECNKRHKTVLTELQAKIARLTKRFGAAKEDLKKRQENPPNPPVSPGKSTANEVVSINNLTYRNAGTVRQMLESKRNIGENTPSPFQAPVNAVSSASIATPQTAVSGQPKSQTPVTSGSLTASVLPAPTTAPVVASTQVSSGNSQPTISLQSLPVILHVPVAVSSQPQLLQGHTGTLVTNQQSGNVEFISVQSQSTVSGLTKNPAPLPSTNSTKPNNSPSVPSPSIQRNSPASAAPLGTTLAVQAISAAHPIAQATRTSLPAVGTSGLYNPANNRSSIQMKIPLAAFGTTAAAPAEPSSTTVPSRVENQTSKTTDTSVNKRAAETTPQSGKATGSDSGGVIDLTLDDEEVGTSQDPKKLNHTPVSAISQSAQPLPRPLQPLQPAPLQQTGVPTSGPSQTTIHLLPTAPTTVNVTHRPVTQATTRLPIPRVPTNHQVVYTTLPAPPAQAPVRGAVLQNSTVPIRQVNPPNGVTVRVPQAATYVVNNGLTLGSTGPQLTVHHRPPQVHPEPSRPVHPAPLPEAPQPQRLPPEAASTSLPQKPHLKLARVQSQNGIVLSWSVLEVDRSCASVDSYHLYAYHEDPSATMPSQWKKIGEVKALPLPMACTLTQFVSGSKYYFAVRAKDIYGRFGPFCDPQSTDVISSQSS
ncbi:activating transcription factor 7-interacting protein 1 isoform X1 [Monodelphis domestica]|uniref:activating transcription factor 7-interacting protein 1 isoform X1 n=1 Tax=Monodelphis domestica TaxID=13616 RepID=UPI0024E1C751|nr:activating transcription factor 7-interacting protein 1 isoform X1 [Monodelphis domestica]XP_007503754.2 activating transcription factor 7-interacting protein 1 isoform X1 [Monodelphis domestica]XP_007503755.2 activating transcription factor 7-interacting protein 1 isoform X1 [Monodelphis domestica]XP_007503756.2 activating transcription factor 7-interacting protein 1 isoform X1 [Monodelphis domestica]